MSGIPRELEAYVDGLIERIVAAQQSDGYLNTSFTIKDRELRWKNLRLWHELYCAGHLLEAAAAYHEATGKRRLLDAAIKFADHIDRTFGPGKRYDVPGHQELELALVKLHRATGEVRYLELARLFLDERGHAHGRERKPFDPDAGVEPELLALVTRERRHGSLDGPEGRRGNARSRVGAEPGAIGWPQR